MVLALSVHPFKLPPEPPPVTVELLPPLVSPPPPVELEPKPLPPEPAEVLRRLPSVLDKPILIERPTPPAPPKTVEIKLPPEPVTPEPAPPAPLEAARPLAPVLPRPLEVQKRPSPTAAKPLQIDRASPALPQPAEEEPAKSVSAPPAPAQVQVLTNSQVVQAPVEIRPPARPANPLRDLNQGAPQIPLAAGPDGGGASGGGGGAVPLGGLPAGGSKPFTGKIVGFDDNGVRTGLKMRLGCLNPDTYHLSAVERAECLRRLAEEAKNAAALAINISPAKQAEFDRQRACHAATAAGGAVARSIEGSPDTGQVAGLGSNPRLRDCGPGDR